MRTRAAPGTVCYRGAPQYKLHRANFPVRAEQGPAIAARCPLPHSCQVLVVTTDPLQCAACEETLARLDLQSVRSASLTDARSRIDEQAFQFVLCSDDLPDCNLRTAVRVLAAATGGVPVIVLSHLADWDAYLELTARLKAAPYKDSPVFGAVRRQCGARRGGGFCSRARRRMRSDSTGSGGQAM